MLMQATHGVLRLSLCSVRTLTPHNAASLRGNTGCTCYRKGKRSKPLLGRDQASHLGKCASADAGRVLHIRRVVGEAAQHQGGGVGKGDADCIKDEHAICGLLGTCVACLSCWAHMPLALGDMPYC